jgi:hypothetical protein
MTSPKDGGASSVAVTVSWPWVRSRVLLKTTGIDDILENNRREKKEGRKRGRRGE